MEHLLAQQRQTGVTPQMLLDAPPLPEGCEALWAAFSQLHACRGWNMAPSRITFTDLDAFQRVTRSPLRAWEIEAIQKADEAFLKDWAERQSRD